MSFGKENQTLTLPSTQRTDHLVCAEPLCATSQDPYTGRIICRCYQLPDPTREPTPSNVQMPHPPMTSSYPGMYTHSYGLDATSPISGAMHPPPGGRWDPAMFAASSAFPPTTFPSSAAPAIPGQMENILRSQMYNYMYPMLDLNGARRKNATRETTSALKAWLSEHKKNPYPTKAEKIMLAIVTKMTLTQVSTWFANARRRLKKETKGDWSPENSFDNTTMSSEDDDRKSDVGDEENTEQLEKRLGQGCQNNSPAEHGLCSTPLPGITSFSQFSRTPDNFLPGPLSLSSDHSRVPYDIHHGYGELPPNFAKNGNSRLTESDDSDKENSDNYNFVNTPLGTVTDNVTYNVSGSTLEAGSEIPRPKIWSISNIIGSEAGKLGTSLTNSIGPAENTLVS